MPTLSQWYTTNNLLELWKENIDLDNNNVLFGYRSLCTTGIYRKCWTIKEDGKIRISHPGLNSMRISALESSAKM